MKLEPILQGFVLYLEQQNFENGKEYQLDASSLRANIFAHSTEFKKYISEELNLFQNIQSMSIAKILSMEVENGQLVEADEAQKEDLTLLDKSQEELDMLDEISQEEMEVEGEENLDETEIVDLKETPQNATTPEENEDSEILVEILNTVLQDENIIQTYDLDKNNSLDKEEIASFIASTKTSNENQEEFSLDNLFFGIEQVKNEAENTEETEETGTTKEAEQIEETEQTEEVETEEAEEVETEAEETKEVSTETEVEEEIEEIEEEIEEVETEEVEEETVKEETSQSHSSSGGSSNSGNYSNKNTTQNTNTNTDASANDSYENMTEEELNQALVTAKEESSTKQNALSALLNGSDERIKAIDEEVEGLYSAYLKELETIDSEMTQQTDLLKENISTKEQEINAKDQEIVNQQTVVSDSETAYNNATATREQLEASLSTLQNTSTSNLSQDEISDLNSKKSQLEAQIITAKQNEQAAQEKLNNDKATLDELNAQKEILTGELELLNNQKTELDAQIAEKYPQVKELQDTYNTAKNDSTTIKTELINTAKSEVSQAQEKINKINTALNTLENKETEKEYNLSPLSQYDQEEGEKLVNAAKQMLNTYGSSTGYCATGVSRTMNIAYGISMGGHGYQWDSNMDELVSQGMFTEVTSEYPSADLLSTLPAGAVVCWENTSNSGGGGKQYGHVCVADGNGGEISDHYQANIYTSIGGRSDQYRIFIPV